MAEAAIIALSALGGATAASALSKKPKPRLPSPVPMPQEKDIEKMKRREREQLMKRATQTTFTGRWLGEPTLLTRGLSGV